MKQFAFRLLMAAPLLIALSVFPVQRVAADDDADELKVEVQAPLDQVDCVAQTITVLGLTIDISKARFDGNEAGEDNYVSADMDDDADDDIDDDADDDVDDDADDDLTCADLVVGQVITLKLSSDIPDPATGLLSAIKVNIGGEECEDGVCDAVKISAPIQAIAGEPNPTSITVLGLNVDISTAILEGDDDEDSDENNQPVDVTQLIVGQFAEMTLVSNQPPLVAKELEIRNFTNEVDIDVDDENGEDIDDGDVDDVQVTVQSFARGSFGKVVIVHSTSNGSFSLSGLPTGLAKIVVTRIHDGYTTMAKRWVLVKANSTRSITMRLRRVR